jgi:hypothetical protein
VADPTRVYGIYFANTTTAPTEAQWNNLAANMIAQSGTLAQAIYQYGETRNTPAHKVSFSKASRNAAYLRRYRLLSFEIDPRDIDNAVALINSIATARSIAGNISAKAQGILQAEAREAMVRGGFSQAQANLVSVAGFYYAERMIAIESAQAYFASNADKWYE